MARGDDALACATALVGALADGGARHACVSPGSRSTPLALALARDERLDVTVHLDERSAGFFGVGVAKASGAPAILACTSGTATAEYLPAVVEASQSRAPLIVLTADRPPALRGTGANQTIDQVHLYGSYARTFVELPVPNGDAATPGAWAAAGREAAARAVANPAGPVHLDCPFDEPLTPSGAVAIDPAPGVRSMGDDTPQVDAVELVRDFIDRARGRRGVVTIGGSPAPQTLSVLSLGVVLGWPVLAEPVSGLRLDASDAGRALAAGQFLIGDRSWLDRHLPEVVLQVGATPTTRATQGLVAGVDRLAVLDDRHLDPDPTHRAAERIDVDPEVFAATAWDLADGTAASSDWLDAWRAADLLARAAVDRTLEGWDEPFEGRIARDVASFLPHGSTLVIGSSTPVRDLDAFMAPRRPPRIWTAPDLLRVIGNRGASGIDGLVSTTLGAAAASNGPTVGLIGDLSLFHDAGALLWSSRLAVDAVLVVLANGGGQIFSMLDQAALPEFEELFLTPHPASIEALCAASGVGHTIVERASSLSSALERAIRTRGVQVLEVPIDAERERTRREEIRGAVARVLGG